MAYKAIRTGIRDGTLTTGPLYSEVQLAEALGISRTPVREALIELAREGIVESVPQRGFRLRVISDHEAREWFDLRTVIEEYVVRRLAAERGPSDVVTLRALLERQAGVADDPAAFLEVDEEFHLRMPALLGLGRTRELLEALRGIIWLAGSVALAQPKRIAEVLEEHAQIVEAIDARDGERAAEAVRSHILRTARTANLAEAHDQAG